MVNEDFGSLLSIFDVANEINSFLVATDIPKLSKKVSLDIKG